MVTTSRSRPAASRRARHLPPHAARRVHAGVPQPHQGRRRTRTSTASSRSRASTSSCSSSTTKGLVATTGCLGGAVSQRAARRRLRRRERARRSLPVGLRARLVLHRAAGPRAAGAGASVNPQLIKLGARPARAVARDQRQSLHAPSRRRSRTTALLCVQTGSHARRPQALQVRRRRVLPEDRGRDARRCSPTTRRRATTRCSSPSAPTSRSSSATRSCRRSPTPQGHDERLVPPRARASRARRSATASRRRPEVVERIEFELGVIKSMGFSAYFLVVWDLVPLRAHARHPRGSRSRERGGVVRRVLPAHHRHRPDQVRPAVRAHS